MEIKSTPSRHGNNVRRSSEFLGFVLLGLPLSYLLFPVFERFGLVGAILTIVTVPFLVFIAVFALPHLLHGVLSMAEKFTWWHWLLLLLFVSNVSFRVRSYQQA